jgi:hypothetical protein
MNDTTTQSTSIAPHKESAKNTLKGAEEMLYIAFLGLDLVRGNDARARMAGLRNVAVFGRAFIKALENLRLREPVFDEWYVPHVEAMKRDPLVRYFSKLRKKILEAGELHIPFTKPLKRDATEVFRDFKQPPRAKRVFTSDVNGGSGWEIETEAGPVKKFYIQMPVSLPALSLDSRIHLVGAPAELQDLPAAVACERYLNALYQLMATAKSRFQCDQAFYFSDQ